MLVQALATSILPWPGLLQQIEVACAGVNLQADLDSVMPVAQETHNQSKDDDVGRSVYGKPW